MPFPTSISCRGNKPAQSSFSDSLLVWLAILLALGHWDIWCKSMPFQTLIDMMFYLVPSSPGVLCNIDIEYPSEMHLKTQISQSLVCSLTYFAFAQSFWNFAQSTAVILPCPVQNFQTIGQLRWILSRDEISQDLSLMALVPQPSCQCHTQVIPSIHGTHRPAQQDMLTWWPLPELLSWSPVS